MRFTKSTIIFRYFIYLTNIKLSHIVSILLLLVLVPLFVHYYLSKVEDDADETIHRSQSNLNVLDEFNGLQPSDLLYRIGEMLRIKASVSNELRNVEAKSQKLQNEITFYHQQIEHLKVELMRHQSELNKLKTSVEQAQLSRLEALQHNTPGIALPIPLYPNPQVIINPAVINVARCRKMKGCFDYSRCSLTSGFLVFLYNPDMYFSTWNVSSYLKTSVQQIASYNPHFTNNASIACIFLVLVGESERFDSRDLHKLPYWVGDGRNHIILNLSTRRLNPQKVMMISPSTLTGHSMIVQSMWSSHDYRLHHDMIIPPFLGPPGGEIWFDSPSMLPARRKYLLSFESAAYFENNAIDDSLNLEILNLQRYLTSYTSDEFFLNFDCDGSTAGHLKTVSDWHLCKTEKDRSVILRESTFVLIPPPLNSSFISTTLFQTRLFEALKYSVVPLILGSDQIDLPYEEVIDWKKAAVLISVPRITECHWLLRSIPDSDILYMRRQGRTLYEKYFATGQSVIDTILAVVRNRLNIPPPAIADIPAPSIFPEDFKPLQMDPIGPESEPEENLGPTEPIYNSPKYQRNFTIINVQGYELWNGWGDPFHLYPQVPFDLLLPSDAKFLGSGTGFRVINSGAGGAGKEYSENLGGNVPKEQFTIVILTYEREQVLMNSLSRLHGLPYLNKVLVVWNSPTPPLQDLRWPDIGVPIHVIPVRKNSLNNRFLPFEAIETEAVLSVDDDAHLRHDEIIFGFRVWREQREHIVGFPGRYHALDLNYGGWLYNSNYSCELSMVLTGAAFIHKYYLYLYTYWLPQAIRDMVDEYMNCEDIAMNFLVSHVTRKPPVKVTSRWTFRCPGCPVSLSEDETHFNERHKCINFFSKVFGYTPLLNTQFRADSILFKTRIPHDKQKCFKFI